MVCLLYLCCLRKDNTSLNLLSIVDHLLLAHSESVFFFTKTKYDLCIGLGAMANKCITISFYMSRFR